MRAIVNIILLFLVLTFLASSLIGIILIPLYFLFVFFGSTNRKRKVASKIDAMLVDGERIVASAIEYRAMSLFRRRRSIFTTNNRIIFIKRNLLGGYQMMDRKWKDLRDAQMSENSLPGLSGTALYFSFIDAPGESMQLAGVSPDDAAKVYTFAQSQEQAWEEKRRARDLEEKRAASGGINFHGFPQQSGPSEPLNPTLISGKTIDASPSDIVASEINRAKVLLDSGSISDDEFQEIKSKILNRHF
ncbi:hypothetical protein GOE20_03185 [Sinorhizobium medicae]|nr:hypothetical protein [Sinorhizobium medicae]